MADFKLRPFQQRTVDYVTGWAYTAAQYSRVLLSSPTGSGKTYMQLTVQQQLPYCGIVAPRVEIVLGYLAKLGHDVSSMSQEAAMTLAYEQHWITTPQRLLNQLQAGNCSWKNVRFLQIDEAHHSVADTYQLIDTYFNFIPLIGWTATPYCGSIKASDALTQYWGDPVVCLTYREAADLGYITIPKPKTWPLIDDEIISIRDGQFVISEVNAQIRSRRQMIEAEWGRRFDGSRYDRPIMATFPSVDSMRELLDLKVPFEIVTQDTSFKERQELFQKCLNCEVILGNIEVVSEGVDLPVRVWYDFSPTMSPRMWMQRLGRIMRPGAVGEYICTNRNILRWGFLLEGLFPFEAYKENIDAFGGTPCSRVSMRLSGGFEKLGRFKVIEIPFASGITGYMYKIQASDGAYGADIYAAVVHPASAQVVYVRKTRQGSRYSNWSIIDKLPDDLTGFRTPADGEITIKQKAWWKRSAESFGLDSDVSKVTRQNFDILPILVNTKRRIIW